MSEDNVVFGLSSWDDEGEKKQYEKKEYVKAKWDDLIKLRSGSNQVRFVTQPYKYFVHKYVGVKGDGTTIRCAKSREEDPCPLCEPTIVNERGKTVSKCPRITRRYIGVIDRRTNQYRVLDVSPSLWEKIKDLKNSPWGNPMNYDVTIVVNKNTTPANYYNIIPVPPQPLSESDKKLKESADLEDLLLKCRPFSPDFVLRKIAAFDGVPMAQEEKPSAQKQVQSDSGSSEVKGEDTDFDFPPADVA